MPGQPDRATRDYVFQPPQRPPTNTNPTNSGDASAPPSTRRKNGFAGQNEPQYPARTSSATTRDLLTSRPVTAGGSGSQIAQGQNIPSGYAGHHALNLNSPMHNYGNFGTYPSTGLSWDWHSAVNFGDFSSSNFYEPQGELVQESQNQTPAQEFSIPRPVPNSGAPLAPPEPACTPTQTSPGDQIMSSPRASANKDQQSTPALQPPPRPGRMQTGIKRKAESEPTFASATLTAGTLDESVTPTSKRPAQERAGSTSNQQSSASEPGKESTTTRMNVAEGTPQEASKSGTSPEDSISPVIDPKSKRRSEGDVRKATGPRPVVLEKSRKIPEAPSKAAQVLPAGKVFPIQIGSELFRLSGASISSDAPSYFSHFFGAQLHTAAGRAGNVKTLYIDRDPETFKDISLHLQGYYIKPRDGTHFVRLFADAQFYSLPRLTQQLFKSEIYIRIGDRDFEISRDLFSSPGDSPNYFSLGFAHFFSTPKEVFPGLDRQALLRPPSILPPIVPNRSGNIFAELLKLLQGYEVHIRDSAHRAELLRDARYFHLKGLEQRLLPVQISHNLARQRSEILIRLEDIRQSGVSYLPDPSAQRPNFETHASSTSSDPNQVRDPHTVGTATNPATPSSALSASSSAAPAPGTVTYARPYTDTRPCDLILETGGGTSSSSETSPDHEHVRLDLRTLRVTFSAQTRARIASLFQVIAAKMNLPATVPLGLMLLATGGGVAKQPASPAHSGVSQDAVRCTIPRDAWVEVDGRVAEWEEVSPTAPTADKGKGRAGGDASAPRLPTVRRWTRAESGIEDFVWPERANEWIVRRGHWRVRVEPAEDDPAGRVEVVLVACRIEALSGQRARNGMRAFLG